MSYGSDSDGGASEGVGGDKAGPVGGEGGGSFNAAKDSQAANAALGLSPNSTFSGGVTIGQDQYGPAMAALGTTGPAVDMGAGFGLRPGAPTAEGYGLAPANPSAIGEGFKATTESAFGPTMGIESGPGLTFERLMQMAMPKVAQMATIGLTGIPALGMMASMATKASQKAQEQALARYSLNPNVDSMAGIPANPMDGWMGARPRAPSEGGNQAPQQAMAALGQPTGPVQTPGVRYGLDLGNPSQQHYTGDPRAFARQMASQGYTDPLQQQRLRASPGYGIG